MIDQTNTPSLLDLCPTNLKRVAGTNGGEYKGPCPKCHGKDRFTVQPLADNGGKWWCRQCGESGDTLAFCQWYFGDSFSRACERLGIDGKSDGWQPPAKPTPVPQVHASKQDKTKPAFRADWQQAAAQFVFQSVNALWTPAGVNVRMYLQDRGINSRVMRAGWIGYNATYRQMTWGDTTVKLPRGVVIPWLVDGSPRKMKVRRSNYDLQQQRQKLLDQGTAPDDIKLDKYMQASGGASHDLYHISSITGERVILVETELDALMLESVTTGFTAVAVGAATDGYTPENMAKLSTAAHVYGALDGDKAGYEAYLKWRYALGKKHMTRLPFDDGFKDPGEIFQRFGAKGIHLWLQQYIGEVA